MRWERSKPNNIFLVHSMRGEYFYLHILNPSESTNFSHQTKYVNSKRGRDINKIDLILIDFYLISPTCRHFLSTQYSLSFFFLSFFSLHAIRRDTYSMGKMKIEKWFSIVRKKHNSFTHVLWFYMEKLLFT